MARRAQRRKIGTVQKAKDFTKMLRKLIDEENPDFLGNSGNNSGTMTFLDIS